MKRGNERLDVGVKYATIGNLVAYIRILSNRTIERETGTKERERGMYIEQEWPGCDNTGYVIVIRDY